MPAGDAASLCVGMVNQLNRESWLPIIKPRDPWTRRLDPGGVRKRRDWPVESWPIARAREMGAVSLSSTVGRRGFGCSSPLCRMQPCVLGPSCPSSAAARMGDLRALRLCNAEPPRGGRKHAAATRSRCAHRCWCVAYV